MDQQNDFGYGHAEYCTACTDRICEKDDGCSYQSEMDKMLGIHSYRLTPEDWAVTPSERACQALPPSAEQLLLEGKSGVIENSAKPPAPAPKKRGRPPKTQSSKVQGAGSSAVVIPRHPGGQPGNLNAVKHGLYVQGSAIYNTNPLERAALFDLNYAIDHLKAYFDHTFEEGMKLKSMAEINETLHNLSLASIALTRLIICHDRTRFFNLPADRKMRKNPTQSQVLDYYRRKVDSFMDFSALQNQEEES